MPTPKEIVLALMKFEGREEKAVTENGKTVQHIFFKYRCPKPSCALKTVRLKEKYGFKNPYSHLRSCYGRGKALHLQKAMLDEMFESAKRTSSVTCESISKHLLKGR